MTEESVNSKNIPPKPTATKKFSKLSPEEEKLKGLHKIVKKNQRQLQKYTFDVRKFYKLKRSYDSSIKNKIKQFQSELKEYFNHHQSPIFAYDIEEQNNKVVCFCAIELFPDLHYKIYFKVAKNIFRYYKSNELLHSLIQNLFGEISADIVIAHGNNQKERQFAEESGKILKNTEEFAKYAMNSVDSGCRLDGCGLHHFEAKIDYDRTACKFFKHEWVWFSNFSAMEWSFRNYLLNQEQRICLDCKNPQDVLLYCLEDAISSLFLYCWYENHKFKINPDIDNE